MTTYQEAYDKMTDFLRSRPKPLQTILAFLFAVAWWPAVLPRIIEDIVP